MPREANPWAATERLAVLPVTLLCAWLIERISGRRQLLLPLSTVGLLALSPTLAAWPWINPHLPEHSIAWWAVPAAYLSVLAIQVMRWVGVDLGWGRRLLGSLLVAGIACGAQTLMPEAPWFWQTDWDEEESSDPLSALALSAEAVWNAQPDLMRAQIDALSAEDPDAVELYAIGMAGDGNETVFHNEVRYFERLVSQRLSRPGHVISLINHPLTTDSYPLASVSNLRQSLSAMATVMNRQQDILLVFVTSHGSADHQLLLGLDPLPLDQMTPQQLREDLDAAGIRWRVLVISACYSGGFIEPLKSPDTLIITAARHDRTSFGCGSQSKITWFGEAFLVEALNQSIDFSAAFQAAKRSIRARERENEETPSHPQLFIGDQIDRQLSLWRNQVRVGPPVAFEPPDLFAERLRKALPPKQLSESPGAATTND